jgi:hypothetical protein
MRLIMAFFKKTKIALCALVALSLLSDSPVARAAGLFEIHLNLGPGLAANPDAAASFERAAAEWGAAISSPIRVNINADLGTFTDPNIIGATDPIAGNPVNLDYTTVRDRMAQRSVRPGNAVLAFLPTTSQITANVPAAGSFDKTTLGITRANQKALGLVPNPLTDTAVDGTITFNQAFTFDFNRTGGVVDPNKIDFQTAAAHEIGHVLGFLSDVDDYDQDPTLNDNATTLDLFRFATNNKPATFDQFRDLPHELRPGVESVTSDTTVEYAMSTGVNTGDGRQAAHWKDDLIFDGQIFIIGPTIGIMDPSLNDGVFENVSDSDLRAMELIGYDTPEPGGMMLAAIGGMAALGRRRSQNSTS